MKYIKISLVVAGAVLLSACGGSSITNSSKVSTKEEKSVGISDTNTKISKGSANIKQSSRPTQTKASESCDVALENSFALKQVGELNVTTACDDSTEITAEDMALSNDGKFIFLADGSAGLKVISVEDPTKPELVGSYDDPCDKGENKGGFGRRIDISSDGDTIYMADGLAGLKIIDVSNPYCPSLLGKVDTKGFSHGIKVSNDGNIVYVADNGEDGGEPGLRVIDVSNPYCPKMIAERKEQWATQANISNDDKTLYITDKKAGVLVIDVTNPSGISCADKKYVGNYKITDKGISADIVLSKDGKKAYVANKKPGIKILDISNSSNPTLISKFDNDGFGGKSIAKSIALSNDGKVLYVANRKTGVMAVDVSDASNPKLLTTAKTSGIAEGVMVSKCGNYLYVADGKAGIKVLKITK